MASEIASVSVTGRWACCLSNSVQRISKDHIVSNKILASITVTEHVKTLTSAVCITTSSPRPRSATVTGLG